MEYSSVKHFRLYCAVALLVFFCGTGTLLFLRQTPDRKTVPVQMQIQKKTQIHDTPIRHRLPPLRLPPGARATPCTANSWEYSGEVNVNFVSARGRLSSWFQNQSWLPERKITLDESLNPKVILTFSCPQYELTLLIWKINTDLTGFSYRRDIKNEPSGGITE